jgi:Proto-chlorophyllide reductase 57 kD subunit
MKFLCIPCDAPMRLTATQENEPGSLSVVYGCPECGYEMAMLTNVQETQMVRSLGVRIGPAAGTPNAAAGEPGTARCPFGAMLGGDAATADAAAAPAATGDAPSWTPAALARLEAIPEMVRPMARAGIEMVAREAGHDVIDEAVLQTARSRFGM